LLTLAGGSVRERCRPGACTEDSDASGRFPLLSVRCQAVNRALAAQCRTVTAVVAGTTLGMLIANVPTVLLGDRLADKIPARLVHSIAAAICALLGVATLVGADRWFGP
jgi:hypothetical protein